jgi:hypothetical protein
MQANDHVTGAVPLGAAPLWFHKPAFHFMSWYLSAACGAASGCLFNIKPELRALPRSSRYV